MIATLAIVSIVLQVINVYLTLRLISVTGRSAAWLFFAGAMVITVLRRIMLIYNLPNVQTGSTLVQEWLVVIGSACVLLGLYRIRPLFVAMHKTQQDTRESEEQYRSLTEGSPLPFVVCRESRIEFANRSAMAIFGVDDQQRVLNRPLIELVHPDFREIVREQLQSLSETEPSQPLTEIRILRPNGDTVDIEIIVALFIFGGNLAQYVLMWDVSLRKQHEEALREREAELAHVMRLHTMGEIAAEMAHEINQPLYAISNFAQAGLMHVESSDPERAVELKHCLEHIHTQAARAAQIVKNLRHFVSKAEGSTAEVSINQLLKDSLELVAIEVRRKRCSVDLRLSPEDAVVMANAVQIQQVIVNLLVNAFEAMEALAERIRRVTVQTVLHDRSVEVIIADSGPGIAADQLNHIFEPFFTTKSHGMGMGLAVSRTIVINHGGKLTAELNSVGGTTFRLTLPREPASTELVSQQLAKSR